MTRPLVAASGGQFWAYESSSYRLDRYSADGRLLYSLDRESDWFPPNPVPAAMLHDGLPHITALLEDSQGQVWVAVGLPDPDAVRMAVRAAGRETPVTASAPEGTAVLEVIDTKERRVVARRSVEHWLFPVSGIGLFYSRSVNDDGEEYIEIWCPKLVRR
jgi:hypothetical protein